MVKINIKTKKWLAFSAFLGPRKYQI